MSLDKILITGAGSGLGKFLCLHGGFENIVQISRDNSHLIKEIETVDVIIHCAFSGAGTKSEEITFDYVRDNIVFTDELLKIKHKKFIYISSCVVYDKEVSLYKITKLMRESLVKAKGNNFAIIRPSSIIGPTMKKNTITKIASEKSPILTLAPESSYNFVSQQDISQFIKKIIAENICGVENFVSPEYITLKEIADMANSSPQYGSYVFNVPKVAEFSRCTNSSRNALKQYLENRS